MNGSETHLNGGGENGGLKITTEDAVEDPEILAAIAASKQDLEEEADPAVLAAIEASKQETDVDGDAPKEELKKESKGPILMFSTLGRNDEENNEDDYLDGHVEEEPLEDNNGHAEDEAEPGDLDPDDDPDDPPPMEEDEAPKKEKLNHTLRRAYLTKVKPEKRYCSSDDDDDDDYGAKKKKKKAPVKKTAAKAKTAVVVPSGPSTVFKCPNCSLTFETIGQLNVHKHQTHGEDKPSILDMGEAVIARLQEKSGAPKDKVLKNILADFGEMVEDAAKVENKLGIALVEGIEWGRLRQGTSGKKNWNNYWLQENAKKRKTMMDKWVAEPSSVGDHSTSGGEVTVNIIENSGEFLAIKEKLNKYNIQVTTSVKKPDPPKPKGPRGRPKKGGKVFDDDDDDIEIVSEKISQKTKLKILQKKKMQSMRPKAIIKVNSAQGKQMLKTIKTSGKVPASLSSSTASSSSKTFSSSASFGADDDDDDGLSCPTCFSAFWYPTQTYEHMKSVHSIEDPEKYIKEKKKSR